MLQRHFDTIITLSLCHVSAEMDLCYVRCLILSFTRYGPGWTATSEIPFILHGQYHGCWWPGHQQPWYWPSSPRIFLIQHQNGQMFIDVQFHWINLIFFSLCGIINFLMIKNLLDTFILFLGLFDITLLPYCKLICRTLPHISRTLNPRTRTKRWTTWGCKNIVNSFMLS